MCTENGCWIIIVSSLLKWNNYEKIDRNCPVLNFSLNLLIFWTLTKHNSYAILYNVFKILQPYSLCISHPNLALRTHPTEGVTLQGGHASSRTINVSGENQKELSSTKTTDRPSGLRILTEKTSNTPPNKHADMA